MVILFFDGDCGLCNRSVREVSRWKTDDDLYFAPLQGATAREKLSAEDRNSLATVVVWQDGKTYRRAEAIFFLLRQYGGWRKGFLLFSYLPASWSDALYRWIARHRHQFFSEKTLCSTDPTVRKQLLP